MIEEHKLKEWQRQTRAHEVHSHAHTHTNAHTPIPKRTNSFCFCHARLREAEGGFIGKRAVVFSSPKSLGLIREDISELEKST